MNQFFANILIRIEAEFGMPEGNIPDSAEFRQILEDLERISPTALISLYENNKRKISTDIHIMRIIIATSNVAIMKVSDNSDRKYKERVDKYNSIAQQILEKAYYAYGSIAATTLDQLHRFEFDIEPHKIEEHFQSLGEALIKHCVNGMHSLKPLVDDEGTG